MYHRSYANTLIEAERKPFNLIRPGSSCPACKASIRAWQNIPIISYLILRVSDALPSYGTIGYGICGLMLLATAIGRMFML